MMDYHGWLVPLGALVVAAGGIACVHIMTRRLERELGRKPPAE